MKSKILISTKSVILIDFVIYISWNLEEKIKKDLPLYLNYGNIDFKNNSLCNIMILMKILN